jgi:hypothetical protein
MEKPTGFSRRLNLEEEMPTKHLNFLALMLVIVIIKVKIIIKNARGLGRSFPGPVHPVLPANNLWQPVRRHKPFVHICRSK